MTGFPKSFFPWPWWVAAWLVHSILIMGITAFLQGRGLDSQVIYLSFHLDDLVNNLQERGEYIATDQFAIEFHCHRMPFIPLVLAGLLSVTTNWWIAVGVKVLAVNGLVWVALFVSDRRSGGLLRSWQAFLPGVLLLAFPAIINQQTTWQTEESWLIGAFALIPALSWFGFRSETQLLEWSWALLIPALYLMKSSLVLICAGALLLLLFRRRFTIFWVSAILLLISVLSWNYHCYNNTGAFRLGTTLDSWNLAKGNNEFVLSYYPDRPLDWIDQTALIDPAAPLRSEQEFSDYYAARAGDFIANNSGLTALHALVKTYVLWVEPWNPPPARTRAWMAAAWISAIFMAGFRLLFWAQMLLSIRSLIRQWDGVRLLFTRPEFYFVALILAYSAPYIIGFAYQRHALPLVPFVVIWTLLFGFGGTMAMQNAIARDRSPAKTFGEEMAEQ